LLVGRVLRGASVVRADAFSERCHRDPTVCLLGPLGLGLHFNARRLMSKDDCRQPLIAVLPTWASSFRDACADVRFAQLRGVRRAAFEDGYSNGT
jgi:hypothetical protein